MYRPFLEKKCRRCYLLLKKIQLKRNCQEVLVFPLPISLNLLIWKAEKWHFLIMR